MGGGEGRDFNKKQHAASRQTGGGNSNFTCFFGELLSSANDWLEKLVLDWLILKNLDLNKIQINKNNTTKFKRSKI